jgi:hypothetical protein
MFVGCKMLAAVQASSRTTLAVFTPVMTGHSGFSDAQRIAMSSESIRSCMEESRCSGPTSEGGQTSAESIVSWMTTYAYDNTRSMKHVGLLEARNTHVSSNICM